MNCHRTGKRINNQRRAIEARYGTSDQNLHRTLRLGFAGSLAISGLIKVNINPIISCVKRPRRGPCVTASRYQNDSSHAYDVIEKFLDEELFQNIVVFR